MSTVDLNICQSRPIRNKNTLAAIRAYRQTAGFKFNSESSDDRTQLLAPIDVYTVTFGLEADARVNERVQVLFIEEARRIMTDARDSPALNNRGFIYIFHDLADPANVLKIGMTYNTLVRHRQWARALAPTDMSSILLLASYPTTSQAFAERVVHEVLRCHRIFNRINPVNNRQLKEFFTIDNLLALKLFLRQSLRYIDTFCAQWRERRRQRDAAME